MIVLDASVLIAHLDESDPHHRQATALLGELEDEPFVMSSLTLAEVLVGPTREAVNTGCDLSIPSTYVGPTLTGSGTC